jgi:preprotein translocase subunit SecF
LSVAMLWGVIIGTYSSLFIAAPLLYYVRPRRGGDGGSGVAAAAAETQQVR